MSKWMPCPLCGGRDLDTRQRDALLELVDAKSARIEALEAALEPFARNVRAVSLSKSTWAHRARASTHRPRRTR